MPKLVHTYKIPVMPPPKVDLETKPIMRALSDASRALGELKGNAKTIPNQVILIDTLILQEARASSQIENIVTTQDEMYQAGVAPPSNLPPAVKEVMGYKEALYLGWQQMQDNKGILSNNMLIAMFRCLLERSEGFRQTPGTHLKNETTGKVVYVPPQDKNEIVRLMRELEAFINDDSQSDLDPLIKMALIHHQFESIHPFPDGNGRVGRMLNVLYMTRCGLLDAPILYMSRSIFRNRPEYYRLLKAVSDDWAWEAWVLYMLGIIADSARRTSELISAMAECMTTSKQRMREEMPRLYSQDLLNNIFRHPYTKIEFVQRELKVSRPTASRVLKELADIKLVSEHKHGRNNYYINDPLVDLLAQFAGD